MFNEVAISSSLPEAKLKKAARTGTLTLPIDALKGKGVVIHVHPESFAKMEKAKKAGRGVRLLITPEEIRYSMESSSANKSAWKDVWVYAQKTWIK